MIDRMMFVDGKQFYMKSYWGAMLKYDAQVPFQDQGVLLLRSRIVYSYFWVISDCPGSVIYSSKFVLITTQ